MALISSPRASRSASWALDRARRFAARAGWAHVALPLILAVGVGLRLANLGEDSLWIDEAYAVALAERDPFTIVRRAAAVDTHPPLYYILLRGWISAFGDSEYAVRSLSAVIGALVIPVIYQLGVAISTRGVGLVASLLAAVSPLYVRYSQEARMYMLATLLAGVSFLLLIRLLETRSRRNGVLYVLATTLLLYTHVYGLFFVLPAQVLIVFLHLRGRAGVVSSDRRELRDFARLFAAVLLLHSPWLAAIAKQTDEELRGAAKTNIQWLDPPRPGDILDTLAAYAGSTPGLIVIALGCLGAVLVGLRATGPALGLGRAVTGAFGGKHASVLWIWLAVPILAPFLVSVAILPVYLTKYTMPASVAFYLLIAAVIHRLRRGPAGAVVLVAVAALMIADTVSYHRTFTPARWREAVRYLDEQARPGEVIFIGRRLLGTNAFSYYSRRDDIVTRAENDELGTPSPRVWLVTRGDDPERRAELDGLGYVQQLDRRYESDIDDIRVQLFERPA